MSMTFAITAMPRSGTKYLAKVLRGCDGWNVQHEPEDIPDQLMRFRLRSEEHGGRYGEVNSTLRVQWPLLRLDRWGYIYRPSRDVLLSMANWWHAPSEIYRQMPTEIEATVVRGYIEQFRSFGRLMERHPGHVVRFCDLTSPRLEVKRQAIARLCYHLGIPEPETIPMGHENAPASRRWSSLEELPPFWLVAVDELRPYDEQWGRHKEAA